ncbi:MAG: thiol reductant ABC exporter subunit CydC [Actinobacteria bacterium]|uniref:Unannotated protein n=1 Tax=freshwater metagenome TaxID=449393 RepID=A0A6J7DQC8_9ZZZZ|nr:thiol reductant ABC exporter subunit CydC [Actinomycetota bacterium]
MTPVRRMWAAMAGQRPELVLAGFVGALASASAVALLGTSAWLISTAAGAPPVLTLTVAAVMVRAFALGRAVFRYGERLIGHDAAFRGLTDLRIRVYERLERLAPVGLAGFSRGDLLTRLVADVDAALDLPLRIVLPWAQAALVSAGAVAFCVWLAPDAGLLIGVLVVVGLTLAPWMVGHLASRAEQRIAPAKALLTGSVVTALDATADLVAFGRSSDALAQIASLDDRVTELTRRSSLALAFGGGVGVALQGAAVTGALVLAIPRVTEGTLPAVWLAVVALLPLALFEVLSSLPVSALALQRLRGSADRLAAIDDMTNPVVDPSTPAHLPEGFTGLELRGVKARWSAAGPYALLGVSLSITPGEHVTIVGPSGSGKSTLASVLMGFLGYEGTIHVNGIELSSVSGDELRTRIGLMAQRSHLFDTTVAENVRLGRPGVGDDAVWRALEAAQVDEAVRSMPRQLDTEVGTFGLAVSGGEAQRLALARLLLEPPPAIIFDEPTEHLDPRTAQALEVTLRSSTMNSTRITISHRLDSIDAGSRVIVLRDGLVEACGSAAELAGQGGWFADRLANERAETDMAALIEGLPIGTAVARITLDRS